MAAVSKTIINPKAHEIWHNRFGHTNKDVIKKMASENLVSGRKLSKVPALGKTDCVPCLKGRQTRNSFKFGIVRSSTAGDVVHSDVCGALPVAPIGGGKYFVTFIDAASRFVLINIIRRKSDVTE